MSTSKADLFEQVDGYFKGTKSAIEALTGVVEGSLAYATDTDEFGSYNGSVWAWVQGSAAALAVVYVAKHGNDSNNGLTINRPKLTIGSAITAAATLVSGGAPRCFINILDGGTYTENLAVSTNITVRGASATLVGTITLDIGSEFHIDRHYAAVNDSVMVSLTTDTGAASHYTAVVQDGRGTGGAVTGTTLNQNELAARVLFLRVNQAWVPSGGNGIRDSGGAGFGHIHFIFNDLYLAGNNARGLRANNSTTNLIGYIDHILETGTPTGTKGILISNSGAIVKVTVSEIVADEVWDNSGGGALHIVCPKLTGTRTGNATVAIDGSHTTLTGLQGGIAGEYYHLTAAEYAALGPLKVYMNNTFTF